MVKLRTLRMQLNTFTSGPQAWLFLADARGYLREEGLAVEFVDGDTAANTIPKMAAGGFDAGYGDVNALIEHAAAGKPKAPLAVFASYNASPYTIAVPATSAIGTPADLAGKTLSAHPNDAALRLLPEFGVRTGLDPASVRVDICDAPHSAMVPRLLAGEWDGMFGFVNTLVAASVDAGLEPDRVLRFIEYHDHVPELYGMAILVTRQLAKEEPEAVRGLLRAFNRALRDTVADPEAAMQALQQRKPDINMESNRRRLLGTLQLEMGRAEGARLGIGDLDDERLARGIALIAKTKGLPLQPAAGELFDRSFLPPLEERVRDLAVR
jgi:NitT/TauT family transport system substrate-binding protein